ncbi:MAG: sigma-70 family RNA polymerase sigma factor [Proteobacteria bacterium]|nr:sigma-70 family RNA polymerase sigma factor [Pseudomonadota bacterium]
MNGFDTTQWSMILASAGEGEASVAALDRLCGCYRAPVLAFLRSRGATPEEAEDTTQSFFAHLIDQRLHRRADPQKGSFRAFLFSALKHFVISEQRRDSAGKRGGSATHVPLEAAAEPVSEDDTPDRAFERSWAQTVVAQALRQLRAEARAAGKLELFDALRGFLFETPERDDYARVSQRFGMSRNTLAVSVHRLRQRMQELVCEVVGRTVDDPARIPAEVDSIQNLLARGSVP